MLGLSKSSTIPKASAFLPSPFFGPKALEIGTQSLRVWLDS